MVVGPQILTLPLELVLVRPDGLAVGRSLIERCTGEDLVGRPVREQEHGPVEPVRKRLQVVLRGPKGEVASLSQMDSISIRDPISIGWAAYRSVVEFHKVTLRMLSGKAEILR